MTIFLHYLAHFLDGLGLSIVGCQEAWLGTLFVGKLQAGVHSLHDVLLKRAHKMLAGELIVIGFGKCGVGLLLFIGGRHNGVPVVSVIVT